MRTFLHSGRIGDIIWSLPFIKKMGGAEVLYLGLTNEFTKVDYDYIVPLLETVQYIKKIEVYGGQHIDYNLDLFRRIEKPEINLAERYFLAYNTPYDYDELHMEPWLGKTLPSTSRIVNDLFLIARGRNMPSRGCYNDSIAMMFKRGLEKKSFFVGLDSEYASFCYDYGVKIPFIKVRDAYEMYTHIGISKMVIANQTSTSAIAEAMKVPMILETRVDAGKYDCQFTRPDLFYI